MRTVNDELERIWKEAVVAYFKVLSQQFSGTLKKPTNTLSQESQIWDRE
jgi:hypothetical protein